MISVVVDVRNEQCEVVRKRAENGYLRIYAGGKRAILLAELRINSFNAPEKGKMVCEDIGSDMSAKATGRATRYAVLQQDESLIWDGNVSKRGDGGSLELDNIDIQQGAEVSIKSITYSLPA